jgi:hypothetical protein
MRHFFLSLWMLPLSLAVGCQTRPNPAASDSSQVQRSDVPKFIPGTTGEAFWEPMDSLSAARDTHTATLLPSGTLLVAGGFSRRIGALSSCELYDPESMDANGLTVGAAWPSHRYAASFGPGPRGWRLLQ